MIRLIGRVKQYNLDSLLAEAATIFNESDAVVIEVGIHVDARGYRSIAVVSEDRELLEKYRVGSSRQTSFTFEE